MKTHDNTTAGGCPSMWLWAFTKPVGCCPHDIDRSLQREAELQGKRPACLPLPFCLCDGFLSPFIVPFFFFFFVFVMTHTIHLSMQVRQLVRERDLRIVSAADGVVRPETKPRILQAVDLDICLADCGPAGGAVHLRHDDLQPVGSHGRHGEETVVASLSMARVLHLPPAAWWDLRAGLHHG